MVNRLFIAEKRSLADEIASSLKSQGGSAIVPKGNTHLAVGDDVVTWLRGHMYENCKPNAYGIRFGDLSAMPVVLKDDEWKMEIREDEKSPGWYKKQVQAIQELASQSREIINVGDAGREGQLLVDECLNELNVDPYGDNVRRLWIKSLTPRGIAEAMSKMEANARYRSLCDSALGRQRADWMHGMTFTGEFTTFVRRAGGQNLISIGRVQTVILRIVADRDNERRNFVPVDHFRPFIRCEHPNGTFSASWEFDKNEYKDGLITDKAVIDALAARVNGKNGTISSFASSPKTKSPPLTFSLSTLNIFCSRRFGMTSDRVLEIAQSLYDKKITSYPRTDSEYLNNDQFEQAPEIIRLLQDIPGLGPAVSGVDMGIRTKVWNSSKVTDHYAIIPTEEATADKVASLSADEKRVFDIIARHYLAQFYPDQKWNALSAGVEVGEDRFRATGVQPVSPGWKSVFDKVQTEKDDDDEEESTLPIMEKGDGVKVNAMETGAQKTKKPSIMTDDSLEVLLNKPYLLEQNPEVRKKIKETDGIGRTSTRPSIMKTLLARGYLVRGKKKKTEIESTELGRSLIDVLPEELKSIGMTAMWEGFLDQINQGKLELSQFLSDIRDDLKVKSDMFIERYGSKGLSLKGMSGSDVDVKPLPGDGEKCPKCDDGIMKTHCRFSKKAGKNFTALFCEKENGDRGCGNIMFPDPSAGLKPLPGDGETCPECGKGIMKTQKIHSKKTNKDYIVLSCRDRDDPSKKGCGKLIFPDTSPPVKPLPGEGEKCPNCDDGHLHTRKQFSKKKNQHFVALFCEKTGGQRGCGYIRFPNPNADLKPIEGDGKTCAKCGEGVMKTWKIHSNKTNKDYIVLACRNAKDPSQKGCGEIEFPQKKK